MSLHNIAPRDRQSLLVPQYLDTVRQKVQSHHITRSNNSAYNRLIAEAEFTLSVAPLSVTHKKHTPPSGDKRDYLSLSIYFWPNPDTEDGFPYVPRDGEVNPAVTEYDRPRFVAMFNYVDTLSLAYTLSGDERFAAKAIDLLRAWFIDEKTRMNPNMLFAQYIPGDKVDAPWSDNPARYVEGAEGRNGIYVSYGGIIDDLNLVPLTDCINLLRESPAWTEVEENAICEWYRDYTDWLLTHQHGMDAAACRNFHGSWYWADIICFLNFTGEAERARKYASLIVPERYNVQIQPDGSQPEELVRAISKHYVASSLCSLNNIALAAESAGIDMWSYETEDGRSLTKAMCWMFPYLAGEMPWQWRQSKPFNNEYMVGPFAAFAHGTNQPLFKEAISRFPGITADSRQRLIYDV